MTDSDVAERDGTEAPAAPSQFPCGQCGAILTFSPGTGHLKCPYCGHENAIPQSEADIEELDFDAALAEGAREQETAEVVTIKCQSCAAEFTLPPNVQSDRCPFCGSTIVAEPVRHALLKPRSLLPFRIEEREARERFRKWLGSRWFAPATLSRFAKSDGGLVGMYVPYWTYDSDTTSFYRGERGTDYVATETYTAQESGRTVTRTRQVTRTKWRAVSGTVWRHFDDVLVLASSSLPRGPARALEPWDLENLAPYQDSYLSGFRAETYQVDLPAGFETAKSVMDGIIREEVRRRIGGNRQRIHSVRTRHAGVTYKHLLLPVWMNTYRYGGKPYTFLVNGRTGEVQGARPYSWVKIGLAILAAAIALGAVWWITSS